MAKTRVLITGGLGFIGSHIADACVKRGDDVFAVDNLSAGKKERGSKEASYFEKDIGNLEELRNVFEKVKPEMIFHCAALARIQPSFKAPDRYFEVNAVGTGNLLSLAKKFGTRRVVYSASSSAYGSQETIPLREEMKLSSQSLNPYASTKRMGEMLMRDLGKITGGPETVCLRYFNVYGPRQTTSLDGPYATVIGIFLDQKKQGKPLTIVPSGHQRRDFTWVGDVVEANLLAGESPKTGKGEIINIGYGKNYSIWEAARLILGTTGNISPEELISSRKCVMALPRQGEVFETLADISKAKELLGWTPKISLKQGLEKMKQGA